MKNANQESICRRVYIVVTFLKVCVEIGTKEDQNWGSSFDEVSGRISTSLGGMGLQI